VIRACEANLAGVTNKTIVTPGRGPMGTLMIARCFTTCCLPSAKKGRGLKQQVRSLGEIVTAGPTAARDEKWVVASGSPANLSDWFTRAFRL
jgi:hypothetical protein